MCCVSEGVAVEWFPVFFVLEVKFGDGYAVVLFCCNSFACVVFVWVTIKCPPGSLCLGSH